MSPRIRSLPALNSQPPHRADLDSLVSAVAYAYLQTHLDAAGASHPATTPPKYVALVQTVRDDLFLRPENVDALNAAALDPASLLTLDDLPRTRLATLGSSFALVDHNVLLPQFGAAKVTAILDHHADEGQHLDAAPRVIKVAGSCTSLVTRHFAGLLPSPPRAQDVPQPLADLLLSAILIDTALKPTPSGKATPDDLDAVAYLVPLSSFVPAGTTVLAVVDQPSILTEAMEALNLRNAHLSAKKMDVAWMSGRDLLRRDYKQYELGAWRYGLSTVPVPLSTWMQKGDGWNVVEKDVEAWMAERNLDMACVLTSYNVATDKSIAKGTNGKHARELLIHVGDSQLQKIFSGLDKDETLQLGPWKAGPVLHGGERWKVWQQGTCNVSSVRRKLELTLRNRPLQALSKLPGNKWLPSSNS